MKTVPLSLLAAMALLPLPGLAQPNESETLNSILAEVRALHADVRLSQTSQILLAELQLQQSHVNAAVTAPRFRSRTTSARSGTGKIH